MTRWAERLAGQRAEVEIDLHAELDRAHNELPATRSELQEFRKEVETT